MPTIGTSVMENLSAISRELPTNLIILTKKIKQSRKAYGTADKALLVLYL